MIKQFNFYDVYGYLLPGLALCALLYAPVGWARHEWPSPDLGSAVLAVVLAYIVGHLLQRWAERLAPAKQRVEGSKDSRYPSDFILDVEDRTLPAQFKAALASNIKASFALDVAVDARRPIPSEIDNIRQAAFRLCRRVLVDQKRAQYAEQFQGLYTMMRGLAAAAAAAAAYFTGMSTEGLLGACRPVLSAAAVVVGVILIAAELAMWRSRSKPGVRLAARWLDGVALCGGFAIAGIYLGEWLPRHDRPASLFEAAAAVSVVAAVKFYGGYRHFQRIFADTVYRDYFPIATVALGPAGQQPVDAVK